MSKFCEFMPFIEAMREEYLRHYPEKGDSWKTCDIQYLWKVLDRATQRQDYRVNSIDHLIDIANICAMLWLRTSEKTGEET